MRAAQSLQLVMARLGDAVLRHVDSHLVVVDHLPHELPVESTACFLGGGRDGEGSGGEEEQKPDELLGRSCHDVSSLLV